MALTVQCQVPGCGAVVDSPPPDSCPKGHPFDPEMVAHQRAIAEGREREYLRERRARARGEQPAEEVEEPAEAPAAEAPKRASRRKPAEPTSEGEPQEGQPAAEAPEA